MSLLKKIGLGVVGVMALVVIVLSSILVRFDIPKQDIIAKYADDSSKFVSLHSGANVHYRVFGNSQAPTLVLLHGLGASLFIWDQWVEALKDDYRLVLLDMPGHGLTGAAPGDDGTVDYLALVVDELLSEIGVLKSTLVGHSLGGAVALTYVKAHPEKTNNIILLASSGMLLGEGEGTLAIFEMAQTPVLKSILPYLGSRSMVEDAMKDSYGDISFLTEERIARTFDLYIAEGNRYAMVSRLGNADGFYRSDIESFAQPTLILWGENDQLLPLSHARRFHDKLPNSTLQTFSGAGHMVMEERPEETVSAVRAFMDKLRR